MLLYYKYMSFLITVLSVPMMPESERNKIALGTAGLLLGLVLLVAGLVYYKKKSSGERQDVKSAHHKKMN